MSKHLSKFKQTSVGVLTALLLASPLTAQAVKITDYSDVGNHWANGALTWAVDNNILVGKSEKRMAPNDYLTRAQLAAMIDRLFGTYKNADLSQYADTVPGSWYYDSVSQAVNMGTFAGYGQNRMGPNDFISREQAIAALARTICLSTGNSKVLTKFPDQNNVSAWACDAVSAMVERQYVVGSNTGNLNPKGNITRAEMAQIMLGIFRSVHNSGELTGTCRNTVLVRGAANIHDAVFEGDPILANDLQDHKLGLNNVTVKGRRIVWSGSEIYINGKFKIVEVLTPQNKNSIKVNFDGLLINDIPLKLAGIFHIIKF